MAAENKDGDGPRHLNPLPETTRGYGRILNVAKKTGKLIYGCGKVVIIRDIGDVTNGYMFHEHKAAVNVAAFSPNGEWVASGDAHGKVHVWSTLNFNIKNSVDVGQSIFDIRWDGDGKRIAAVGEGKQARAKVFSWDSGNTLGEIVGFTKAILACDYRKVRPYRIIASSEDLSVKFFQGPPFKHLITHAKEHDRYPNMVRFAPDGSSAISVGSDSKIIQYDGKTGEIIKKIEHAEGHKAAIYSFAWSPDGTQIFTCSSDKTCKLWNVADGAVVATFVVAAKPQVEDMQIGCVWWGEHLVSLSLSGALNYWDVANPGAPKTVVAGHQSDIKDLDTHGATGKFYTCDANGKLAQWDVNTGLATWFSGKGHGKTIIGNSASADGASVVSVGLDDKVFVNNCADMTFGAGAALGGQPTGVSAGRKDNGLAAVTLIQGAIVVVRDGAVKSRLDVNYQPECCAFNPDDSLLAVGGKDKKVHVYAVSGDELKQTQELVEHEKPVCMVTWNHDGSLLTSAGKDKNIYHWDIATGAVKNASGWAFHAGTLNDVHWAPDGSGFASCAQDESFILWKDFQAWGHDRDAKLGNLSHRQGVQRARYIDPKTLITVGGDRAVRIWKL